MSVFSAWTGVGECGAGYQSAVRHKTLSACEEAHRRPSLAAAARALGFLLDGPASPPSPRARFAGAAARSRSSKSAPKNASRSASTAAVTPRLRRESANAASVSSSKASWGICSRFGGARGFRGDM